MLTFPLVAIGFLIIPRLVPFLWRSLIYIVATRMIPEDHVEKRSAFLGWKHSPQDGMEKIANSLDNRMCTISTIAVDTIGERLKALRKREGWTLMEVAARTGISQGTLSKLENGRTKLNFTSVVKLASGLNLPVTDFTDQPPALTAPTMSGARRSVKRAGAGMLFQGIDMEYEVLADGLAGMRNVFLRARVKQHPNPDPVAFRRHPGQEFIYVVSGELQLETEAYAPIRLQQGDSIVFDSSMGHRYVSVSNGDTILLIEMEVASYPTIIEDLVV